MDLVTSAAGSSLFLIDVHEVQIDVSVLEFSQSDSQFVGHHVGEVAGETQLIAIDGEGRVELRRIGLEEHVGSIPSVRLVTGHAVSISNGSMPIGVVFQEDGHIREGAAIGGLEFLVVAFEAEVRLHLLLKIFQ